MASFDQTIPQAEPNQNVATKSLDDRHAFPRITKLIRLFPQWSFGNPVQNLVDQRKALLDLADTDPNARIDVALIQDGYLKAQAIVWRIGKGPARVEGSAGGAADVAAGGILFGKCGVEHTGIDRAIL